MDKQKRSSDTGKTWAGYQSACEGRFTSFAHVAFWTGPVLLHLRLKLVKAVRVQANRFILLRQIQRRRTRVRTTMIPRSHAASRRAEPIKTSMLDAGLGSPCWRCKVYHFSRTSAVLRPQVAVGPQD